MDTQSATPETNNLPPITLTDYSVVNSRNRNYSTDSIPVVDYSTLSDDEEKHYQAMFDSAWEAQMQSKFKKKVGRKKDNGYKFITLTSASHLTLQVWKVRLDRVLRTGSNYIEKAVGCFELTKEGRLHVHLLVITTEGKYCRAKNICRTNDGEICWVKPAAHPQKVFEYICKDATKPNIEYPFFYYTNREIVYCQTLGEIDIVEFSLNKFIEI